MCSRASAIRFPPTAPIRWPTCPKIAARAGDEDDIACVLVNPLQALASQQGRAVRWRAGGGAAGAGRGFRAAYAEWLARLAEVCRDAASS
jgi:hypothetical protein